MSEIFDGNGVPLANLEPVSDSIDSQQAQIKMKD